MNIKTLFLSITCSLFIFSAYAGSGHNHGHDHAHSHEPVNQEKATANASKIVAALVKRKVIVESWKTAVVVSTEKKVFKGNPEWLITFKNEKMTDTSKQKLYVFLTLGGDYIAANYSGK